ncbi:MAG: SAM-dependent methyltransferase [Burkholderiales bacterium]|jgi:SAM-dependent MidA family methyltransferase|uniref:class I SAM-dependent methyltransferase n=1 Tax=Limnobacter sp. TaxID=2003368 RepID=UPI00393F1CFA|nr:SAM-dependent methyltransferase [Burkholderiales bacterium]
MLSNFNEATRFDEFMRFALYDPKHGYYARGEQIFGREGDFITAPELSPLFGQTLGKALREVLPRCDGVVYEFGAGTGQLACDILQTAGDLITQYNIVDVSAGLKPIQLAKLKALHGPGVEQKLRWLGELPTELRGVVLGNEVLDATPVRRFKWQNNNPLEAWVQHLNGELQWVWKPADPAFATTVSHLQATHGPWPEGYESEIAEQSIAWVKTVTERLNGLALMIDYGFHEAMYYHPTRSKGTLRATSRHTAHDDFLVKVGNQDLTAHVNFSSVYDALTSCGGELEGYAHQGEFLLAHGILELAQKQTELTHPTRGALMRQNLNTLLNEADMGEAFKVICWSKGVNAEGTPLAEVFVDKDRSGEL